MPKILLVQNSEDNVPKSKRQNFIEQNVPWTGRQVIWPNNSSLHTDCVLWPKTHKIARSIAKPSVFSHKECSTNNSHNFILITDECGVYAFLNKEDLASLSRVSKAFKTVVDTISPRRADELSIDLCLSRQGPPKTLLEKLVKRFDNEAPLIEQGHYSENLRSEVRKEALSFLQSASDFLPKELRSDDLLTLTLSQMNSIGTRASVERAAILVDFFRELRKMNPALPIFEANHITDEASEIRKWMHSKPAELNYIKIPESWNLVKMTFPPEVFLLRCFSKSLSIEQFEQMLEIHDEERDDVKKGAQEFLLAALDSRDISELGTEAFQHLFRQTTEYGFAHCLTKLIASGRLRKAQLGIGIQTIARNGHANCLRQMMAYDWFENTEETVYLSKAFKYAAENGHAECLELMISCVWYARRQLYFSGESFSSAAANGHAECLGLMISCNLVHTLQYCDFYYAVSQALEGDHARCLEKLIACHRFKEKFSDYFMLAAKNGKNKCLGKLIACDEFKKISRFYLGMVMTAASQYNQEGCLEKLIACDRFKEISTSDLGEALKAAIKNGSLRSVEKLIACDRFKEISTSDLGEALKAAIKNDSLRSVEKLIACDRFKEISTSDLGKALRIAAEEGHWLPLEKLIACDRFKEISTSDLGEAILFASLGTSIRTTAQHRHVSWDKQCFKVLMSCPRFREIPPDYLGMAVIASAETGNTECLQSLIACDRFKEISSDHLGMAFIAAAENGHAECFKKLDVCDRSEEISTYYRIYASVQDLRFRLGWVTNNYTESRRILSPGSTVFHMLNKRIRRQLLADLLEGPLRSGPIDFD